ncbi:MAG: NfeD family protein [Acidobacteria bacterium]|nr:NfeD family protein [Acidobacteriota bacterium]
MVFVWIVLAVVLLWVELHHVGFYAVFGAIGSVGAAVAALVAPSAVAVQAGVLVALSVVGVVAVRPRISKVFADRRTLRHVATGVHGGLVGHEALTEDEVGGALHRGHVRLAGERWLAASTSEPIGPGRRVLVRAVEGTTLMVEAVAAAGTGDSGDSGDTGKRSARAGRPLRGRNAP